MKNVGAQGRHLISSPYMISFAAAAVVAATVTDDSLGTRPRKEFGQPLEEGQPGWLGEASSLPGPADNDTRSSDLKEEAQRSWKGESPSPSAPPPPIKWCPVSL